MRKTYLFQVNNLKIYRIPSDNFPFALYKYAVYSPDGKCLDEFSSADNARNFADMTKDFIKVRTKYHVS